MESVNIPNSVTKIESSAFSKCTSLTEIELPDGLVSIGNGAFLGCSSLTNIEIPSGVESIGNNAFINCENLKAINVDENNNYYSSIEGVLFNEAKTILIYYPGSKGEIYKVPEGTIEIKDYAFEGTNIKCLDIPEGVTKIGTHSSSSGIKNTLKKLRIPNSVTSIADNCFSRYGDLIIYCNSNSYAKEYALEEAILYDSWDNYYTDTQPVNINFEDENLYNKIINEGISCQYTTNGGTSGINMAKHIINEDKATLTIQMEKCYVDFVNMLYIPSSEIKSLKGIEKFPNLKSIWASHNEITDLAHISNMTELEEIDFEYNNISDISALQNLNNLKSIYLMANMAIEDVNSLKNKVNLKMLDLTANLVEDISPITNLTNLTGLYLGINSIKNIENIGN